VRRKVLDRCDGRLEYADVIAICKPLAEPGSKDDRVTEAPQPGDSVGNTKAGFVYMGLLRLGRAKHYKIDKAVLVERRTDQISLQLPEDFELVHSIRTDDAYGMEEYWHKRFSAKNTKGEWFLLSRQDVDALRRRKFM
jgi:hypothetical protein